MTNCEAITFLDSLIKSKRANTPKELRECENLALAKAISVLWPGASLEEDFEKSIDYFRDCCIKGEADYLQRYHKTPDDSILAR